MVFPFDEYWHLYAWLTAGILAVVLLDLGVFHRKAHVVTVRESLIWSVIWVALSLLVGAGIWAYTLHTTGDSEVSRRILLEYLTGYVVEKSLSVDNIFVFVVIFAACRIPAQLQQRALVLGIVSALILRGLCIAGAAQLMSSHFIVMLFGGLLIVSGLKLAFTGGHDEESGDGRLIRFLKRRLPLTEELHGERFLIRESGRWRGTPLLLALTAIELSDVLFAFDSIPAIFAITKEPFLVFSSNMMAILGLRSLYFLLAGMSDRFVYLKYGLAAVLVFVGAKMLFLNELYGGTFPIGLSLGLIASLIGASVAVSLLTERRREALASGH